MQFQFAVNSRVAFDDDISASGYEAQTNWSKVYKDTPRAATYQDKSLAYDISSIHVLTYSRTLSHEPQ